MLIDAAIGERRAQRFDQTASQQACTTETPGIDEQRQFVEPAEEVVPVAG
jgi:hypothetical protein